MRRLTLLLAAMIVLGAGSIASAHPQSMLHSHVQGFEAGLFHPLLGVDHLLAMVMVGVIAARLSGRAVWLAPAAFVSSMLIGGLAGMAGMPFPGVETAIAVSVIVLGLSAAIGKDFSLGPMLVVCAAFGFVHGHAHGAEMPSLVQPALYGIGFVLSTVALHVSGVLIQRFAARTATRQSLLRLAGAAVAATGLLLLL